MPWRSCKSIWIYRWYLVKHVMQLRTGQAYIVQEVVEPHRPILNHWPIVQNWWMERGSLLPLSRGAGHGSRKILLMEGDEALVAICIDCRASVIRKWGRLYRYTAAIESVTAVEYVPTSCRCSREKSTYVCAKLGNNPFDKRPLGSN